MADETAPHGAEAPEAPIEPQNQETDWKSEARKWENRAKENLARASANENAAQRLSEIEESQKSESQKASEALAAAQKLAAEAEAKVLRRDVALEHNLKSADASLLDSITDETAMRALAARLAVEDSGARGPKPDRNQGTTGGSTATTGDQFAQFFTTQVGG